MTRACLAPPRRPPPKRGEPVQQRTEPGSEEKQEPVEYTPEERQAQAERLVELMLAAAERGDREAARRCWAELRRLILARSPAEVAEMERERGLT